MNTVIMAVVVLGVIAAIFGLILAYASKVFAVEKDPREEAIAGCLPGANCGGCGYAGCGGSVSYTHLSSRRRRPASRRGPAD